MWVLFKDPQDSRLLLQQPKSRVVVANQGNKIMQHNNARKKKMFIPTRKEGGAKNTV